MRTVAARFQQSLNLLISSRQLVLAPGARSTIFQLRENPHIKMQHTGPLSCQYLKKYSNQ